MSGGLDGIGLYMGVKQMKNDGNLSAIIFILLILGFAMVIELYWNVG